MPVFWNGIGGAVGFTPTGGVLMIVSNTEWNKDKKNKINDVTNANSGGNEQYISGVFAQTGSFTVVWDSTLPPDTNGLVEGNTGIISEEFGNSGHGYAQSVIIEQISMKVNAQQGAIMYTVTYRGIARPTYS